MVFGVKQGNYIPLLPKWAIGVLSVAMSLTAKVPELAGTATNEFPGTSRALELNRERVVVQNELQSSNSINGLLESEPALKLRSVQVNNREVPGISNTSLYLPAHPDTAAFTYGPNVLASNTLLRFRCQLDGYEQGWHERSVLMRMVIRFIDANQR